MALGVLQAVGMVGRDVAEEGVDRGQADIACRRSAVARRFEVLEEGRDGRGVEVREVEGGHGPSVVGRREAQEEREAVAVTQDRMGAHAAQPAEVLGEEGAQRPREEIRGRTASHGTPPGALGPPSTHDVVLGRPPPGGGPLRAMRARHSSHSWCPPCIIGRRIARASQGSGPRWVSSVRTQQPLPRASISQAW